MTDDSKKHSPIGASSAYRWLPCPGSVKLSEGAPKKTSAYAAEGTVAHSLCEAAFAVYAATGLRHKASEYLENRLDDEIEQDGHSITVTEEMIEAVEVWLETLYEYESTTGVSPKAMHVEHRFALPHIDPEAYGTCDLFFASYDTLFILDYKHGKGQAVEVDDNVQCQYYGLGAYYSIEAVHRDDLAHCEMVIVQPRASHIAGPVRKSRISIDDLLAFETTLAEGIQRVRSGDPSLQSGYWCGFCAAKAQCPELRREVASSAQLDFTRIEDEPVVLPSVTELTDDQLAQLLQNAEKIRGWVKGVESFALTRAEAGHIPTGYKLVAGKANRAWIDPDKVIADFKDKLGDQIFKPKKIQTPKQIELLLPKEERIALAAYWTIPVKGPTLAPLADKREALAPSRTAQNDFTPV